MTNVLAFAARLLTSFLSHRISTRGIDDDDGAFITAEAVFHPNNVRNAAAVRTQVNVLHEELHEQRRLRRRRRLRGWDRYWHRNRRFNLRPAMESRLRRRILDRIKLLNVNQEPVTCHTP